jgi:regulator of protease activity HflC (stomatin/prohibitin superfamily)
VFIPWSFHTVDQSEVAVVKSLGKIKDTQTAGTYFDFWVLNSYTKYSTKVQEVNIDDIAYSSDAQQMTLNIKFQYQIMPNKIKEITTQYGNLKTLEARITPTVRDRVKTVLSKHTAMGIIEKRESISSEAALAVTEALGTKFYVTVTNVAITDIEFSEQFETAVEEKMIAEQNQLKAEYENAAKVAKAEADAKAKLVAAEAEAEANRLLEKSLTDKILQEMYIDKWDGKLPTVVAGEETGIMIPSLEKTE